MSLAKKTELTTVGDLLKQMVVDHHFYGTFILQVVWLVTIQDRLRVVEAMKQTSQSSDIDPALPQVLANIFQEMMTGHSVESILLALGDQANIQLEPVEDVYLEGSQAIVWKEINVLLDLREREKIKLPEDAAKLLAALLNGGKDATSLLAASTVAAGTPHAVLGTVEENEDLAYREGVETYLEAFDKWAATLTKSVARDGRQQVEVISRNELGAWFGPGFAIDAFLSACKKFFNKNFVRADLITNNHSPKTRVFVTVDDARQFFEKHIVPHDSFKYVTV